MIPIEIREDEEQGLTAFDGEDHLEIKPDVESVDVRMHDNHSLCLVTFHKSDLAALDKLIELLTTARDRLKVLAEEPDGYCCYCDKPMMAGDPEWNTREFIACSQRCSDQWWASR